MRRIGKKDSTPSGSALLLLCDWLDGLGSDSLGMFESAMSQEKTQDQWSASGGVFAGSAARNQRLASGLFAFGFVKSLLWLLKLIVGGLVTFGATLFRPVPGTVYCALVAGALYFVVFVLWDWVLDGQSPNNGPGVFLHVGMIALTLSVASGLLIKGPRRILALEESEANLMEEIFDETPDAGRALHVLLYGYTLVVSAAGTLAGFLFINGKPDWSTQIWHLQPIAYVATIAVPACAVLWRYHFHPIAGGLTLTGLERPARQPESSEA